MMPPSHNRRKGMTWCSQPSVSFVTIPVNPVQLMQRRAVGAQVKPNCRDGWDPHALINDVYVACLLCLNGAHSAREIIDQDAQPIIPGACFKACFERLHGRLTEANLVADANCGVNASPRRHRPSKLSLSMFESSDCLTGILM